jgi:hypothetical protein
VLLSVAVTAPSGTGAYVLRDRVLKESSPGSIRSKRPA